VLSKRFLLGLGVILIFGILASSDSIAQKGIPLLPEIEITSSSPDTLPGIAAFSGRWKVMIIGLGLALAHLLDPTQNSDIYL
jgi:2-keto-3-deoxy-6-phosphogluconate aldolase